MAPTIRVDDEVYAALQAEAKPFIDTPNSVLRRKFGLAPEGSSTAAPAPAAQGATKLGVLIREGVLSAGERLVWRRAQQGKTHEAKVLADGAVLTEGDVRHLSPSGAARHVAGYEVNGWRSWRQESTGKTLEELWDEYESSGR